MNAQDLADRCYLDTTTNCWIWQKALRKGYGLTWHKGKKVYAHRLMYEFVRGPIPPGLCVCHSCDNPRCVNPDHLWVGTERDNLRDMASKGRNWRVTCRGADHWNAKLTWDQIKQMYEDRQVQQLPYSDLGQKYRVTPSTAWRLCRRFEERAHVS
jgi:hypothetical protein